jgi:hypothetical protein
MTTLGILTLIMAIRRIARAIVASRRDGPGTAAGRFPMSRVVGTATARSGRPIGPTGFYEVAEGAD